MSDGHLESEAWAAALAFQSEAEQVSPASLPRMAIHAAYYAMFHGARSVLVKLDGLAAPTKHGAVVRRFGYHAKQAGDPMLMAAGRALTDVQEGRERSDYDTKSRPDPDEAATAVKEARRFLETCTRVHGFPPP